MENRLDISDIDLEKYKHKCLLIQKGTCRNVNTFLEQVDIESRLKQCIKSVMQILEKGHGVSAEVIIQAALSEIEKVKDIL